MASLSQILQAIGLTSFANIMHMQVTLKCIVQKLNNLNLFKANEKFSSLLTILIVGYQNYIPNEQLRWLLKMILWSFTSL